MLIRPLSVDSTKGDSDPPALAALKCAFQLMQQRLISNPNDMMGILLYGVEQSSCKPAEASNRTIAYPHCYLLTDLNIPAAEDVKALKNLIEDEDEFNKLFVPAADAVTIATLLFFANQIFTTKAPNFASRRLFIVTDNDDPHAKEPQLKSSAAVRAKDLYDLGVSIELFPISKFDDSFDRAKFYDVR